MKTDYVSLDARYKAIWSEINVRISQRQNALQIYVTLSAAILGILFAGHDPSKTHIIKPEHFVLLIPAFSLQFAWLNSKHELTIKILRRYLKEIEIINNKDACSVNYHDDNGSITIASIVRRKHDHACALIIFVFNALGVAVSLDDDLFSLNAKLLSFDTVALVLYLIVAAFSIVSVWKGPNFLVSLNGIKDIDHALNEIYRSKSESI